MPSALFVALAVGAGFLLGLRVGLVLGRKAERKRADEARKR